MGYPSSRVTEMAGRLLDVTAYTTLEFVEVAVQGPDWTDGGPGVVDVHVPDEQDRDREISDDRVLLELEIDGTSLDHVEPHADCVALTRVQARALAHALVSATGGDWTGGDGDEGGSAEPHDAGRECEDPDGSPILFPPRSHNTSLLTRQGPAEGQT